MTYVLRRALAGLALLASFVACDGADVYVFSAAQAGSAGVAGAAGAAEGGSPVVASAGQGGVAGAFGGGGSLNTGGSGSSGASGSGGSGGLTGLPCHDNSECQGGWLCAKPTCGADLGVCTLPSIVCDTDGKPFPVCGCNHVTYWNDCMREQAGVSASTPGECGGSAPPCYTNDDCDNAATCAHPPLMSCGGPPGPGTCWVTPDCPTMDKPRYQLCPPPGGGNEGPPPCLSTCEAIQSGHPFTQLPHGAQCP